MLPEPFLVSASLASVFMCNLFPDLFFFHTCIQFLSFKCFLISISFPKMIWFFQLPLLVRLSASLRLIELRPPAFVSFFSAAAHECSAPPPGRASFNFFFWRPAGAPARRAERYAGGLAIGTVVGAGSLTASRSDETRLFVSVLLRVALLFETPAQTRVDVDHHLASSGLSLQKA